jgi:ribonuclease HI
MQAWDVEGVYRSSAYARRMPDRRWTLEFDGGCDPNPGGRATYGWVLYCPDGRVVEDYGLVGTGAGMSNNVAEYSGLVAGVRAALAEGAAALRIRGDSELVIKQLLGEYKVRSPKLRPLYEEVRSLLEGCDVEYQHVLRTANVRADALARRA